MEYTQATLRLPKPLSDKLRRAAKRARKPKAVIVREAIDHWITSTYLPGCPYLALVTPADLAKYEAGEKAG